MSRSGRALLSVLALVGTSLAGAADASAFPDEYPPPSIVDPLPEPVPIPVPIPLPVANTPPTVVIEAPVDGSLTQPGEALPFRLTVTDAEDKAVDCTEVVVTFDSWVTAPVGPDCTGVLTPDAEQGHSPHSLSAHYTDAGSLTGSAEVVLNPRQLRIQPEVVRGWSTVSHINLAGVHHLSMELAAWQEGATLTVHADSPDGPVVAAFPSVPATGAYRWLAADVTDPVGVHDLYFVGDEVSTGFLQFQTVPTITATIPPAGWHTTDVPVTVSTAPLWSSEISTDAGTTWLPADAPVVLTADGVHDIRYRAVDAAGRTSEIGAGAVHIDRTAPVLTVAGRHAHTGTLTWAAADATSGVATVAATLDGAPVTAPVELWRYQSGVHQLAVTTTDVAGNTATSTTAIEITASLPELLPLLERFDLPFMKAIVLRLQLMAAARAHNAGDAAAAAVWVGAFQRSASTLRNPAARQTLTTDAALVVTQLRSA